MCAILLAQNGFKKGWKSLSDRKRDVVVDSQKLFSISWTLYARWWQFYCLNSCIVYLLSTLKAFRYLITRHTCYVLMWIDSLDWTSGLYMNYTTTDSQCQNSICDDKPRRVYLTATHKLSNKYCFWQHTKQSNRTRIASTLNWLQEISRKHEL